LTHLLLPFSDTGNKYRLGRSFARDLCMNAMAPESNESAEEAANKLPTNLEVLFLGLAAGPPRLKLIRNGKRLWFMNHQASRQLDYPGEMLLHWKQRMEGKDGCWMEQWINVPSEEFTLVNFRRQIGW